MAAPSHKPTDVTKAEVFALAKHGVTQELIAKNLGIDKKTLYKHYRKELDEGSSEMGGKVMKFLASVASGEALNDGATYADCVRGAMFYGKTRLGLREKEHHAEFDLGLGNKSPMEAIRHISKLFAQGKISQPTAKTLTDAYKLQIDASEKTEMQETLKNIEAMLEQSRK